MREVPTISDSDLADIAALADGSLPGERVDEVRARVAASAELTAELQRQRRATTLVAAAQRRTRAPAELRARVGAERMRRRPFIAGRRIGLATGGIAVAAVALVIALLVIPSGVTGERLLAEAAATHAKPVEGPAPQPLTPTLLDKEAFGVAFPDWRSEFQWEAVGVRADRVQGRDVITVSDRKDDATVGYSVISGDPVDVPESVRTVDRDGVPVHLFRDGDRTIAVFERGGRTCVMSAVGVPDETLVKLAAWQGDGTIPFSS